MRSGIIKNLYLFFTYLPKADIIVFITGLLGIVVGSVGMMLAQESSLISFFDNVHWTFGTTAAALLAFLGFRRRRKSTSGQTALWFWIGFLGYGIGQIVWDIQVYFAYSHFPAPSDFFYLWLGPSMTIALFYEVYSQKKQINLIAFLLDLLALCVATLTLVLVLYLPHKGGIDPLSMGVLVAYPLFLLIPMLMIMLMIPSMRLHVNIPLGLFILGLSGSAWSWMHWNFIVLQGMDTDGAWFNTMFSITILITGLMVSNWQLVFLKSERFDRLSEAFLRFLPITTVLLSGLAVLFVRIQPSSDILLEQQLVYFGAVVVVVLAFMRQSQLLRERDLLLKMQTEALKSTDLIKTILQTAPLRIFWKDHNLNYLGCNDIFARDAGFEHAEQLIGKSDFEMGWSEQAELYRLDDSRVIETGVATLGYEEPQTTPKGDQIWLRTSKVPLVDTATGTTIGVLGIYDDITQQHQIKERLKHALEGSSDGLWDWNMQNNQVYYSPRWLEMLGYRYGDLPETLSTWEQLVHPEDKEPTLAKIRAYLNGQLETLEMELRMHHKAGHWVTILARARLAMDDQGKLLQPQRLVGTHVDISIRKKMEQELRHRAYYDILTSLPNRLLLSDRLQQALANSKRHGTMIAIVYLDLDGFKEVNDRHGHNIGDQLLLTISKRLKQALREGDTLSRLGGDEFVAILQDINDTAEVQPVLDRLLLAASALITIEEINLRVSASIGVTFYPQREQIDADQLVRQADQAMYQAKQSGKNRFHIFDAEYDRAIRSRLESIERIRKALQNREFVLYYQPKVNMRSGAVIGVEALIRWQHPDKGLLSPAAFLPELQQHHLMVDIGDWVIEQAMGQIEQWHAQGIDLPISVNVDSMQLQQESFVDTVRTLLQRYSGVRRGDLEFEILETSALEDVSLIAGIITECRDLGINFALDDFGTGYSSLTYLKRLPVRTLKIDQSFVFDLLDDPEDLAIIEGIHELADTFSREIIAEGVEYIIHGSALLMMGCEVAQGYAIARPMRSSDVATWARQWRAPDEWTRQYPYAKENLPLLYAIVEHNAWVKRIIDFLTHRSDKVPLVERSQCKFGAKNAPIRPPVTF